jgi:RNA ligase (TIGR02306 family)
MRRLATIRLVDDVFPIENADRLEQVAIGGWRVVVGKGEFKKGEKVVYFEIDSALPVDDDRFEFLKERCLKRWMNHGELIFETIRIKSIKLRGVVSQGLVMPFILFPELAINFNVGDDVTEALHIEHYDELAEKCGRIQGVCKIAGNAKGNFPSHIFSKSDEERLQNLTEYFDGRFEDEEFEVTEKFDGSSATYIYSPSNRPDDPFYVCSRNLELKEEEGNLYWDIAKKYNILSKLKYIYEKFGAELVIQGEIVGPGVNKNRDQYTEHEFRVYRAGSAKEHQVFTPDECSNVCSIIGFPHVKVIKNKFKAFKELKTMEAFLEFVKGKTDRGHEREGMVFKSNRNGELHFKVINNDYLLKEKD